MSQTIKKYNTLVRAIDENLGTIKRCGASYEAIITRIRPLIDKFSNQLFHYNQQKTDLLKQKESMDSFKSKAKSAKKVREEKIHKLNESIMQFSNAAKNVLTSMRFKGLAKVKAEPNIERLYGFFYVNLYHEQPDTYNFDTFRKIALDRDLNDFQKRLAKFSIVDLPLEARDSIFELKNADYSLNKSNDELNYLLEWLDYNFESYVLLKEKNSEEKIIKETLKKESIKNVQSQAVDKMLEEINGLVVYLEDNLQHLTIYDKKLGEALQYYEKNSKYKELNNSTSKLFASIDTYAGNDIVSSINNRYSGL